MSSQRFSTDFGAEFGPGPMPGRGPGQGRGPGRGPGGPGGRGRGGRGRGPGGRRGGVGRGDVRIAVLALLSEEPMHGYQIMGELADRSNGVWQPSPGSIYPLLQQMTDEGLVVSEKAEGRKVFSLTDQGSTAAAEAKGDTPVWERIAGGKGSTDLREAVGSVAAAAKQVATTGTTAQAEAAAEILTEARKKLYKLLAE